MASANISCMASGDTGPQLKFFFFGQDTAGSYHLLQTVVDKASQTASNTFKSDNAGAAGNFAALVQRVFASV